ncbi:DNA alkylation response protein [Sulfolobus acidocaldarius]|uniref:Acyl-CoA dehydrogenase n=5 Tax=Sulfolobus acidocaldarius TaxID=2285 RepID=Q4J7Z7_SULAC|nr:acyl-CoA dehydrogenase family protein [Sulfolobus acidocaldarius]AAY81084.1 acyl-CoA dehydrogenase [Sulfolobus acidocaldarius DSM 639]AGE71691.1 acyl-CoA dehydrogenase [Sulfolobus acidocaldarius N8]AGE73964.1 acyl-CoA dehydrogenase [Sulfolobus acidocaldarius Ron12/I]ALU30100.1 DNA alkylation response protein [Sulfolobus acidocaldarius]ALU30792.1 DNA alkylation response protein [Sulfolobus acidocaldarius]
MSEDSWKNVYSYLSNSYGKNHFTIDKPFQQLLKYFRGAVPDLTPLGEFAGGELLEISDYIDKGAHPKHIMWSIDGQRVDEVWISPMQRLVLERLLKEYHVNAYPYKGGDWFQHFASIYLISDPGIACILTVTNQTAYTLYKYGDAYQRTLVDGMIGENDKILFGATWFTEVQGGSDLGANLVEAYKDGNTWKLNGITKYFASDAGLAHYALVTARPKGAPSGAKGLGLFLAPKLDSSGRRNFLIRRLKEKSATISVPTGEVEFHGSEAQPIGELNQGIYYTVETLTVSRIANAFGALGLARKAYLEAYYYAQKRKAFGKPLIEHPLVRRDLLDMEVYIEGTMALALKSVSEFQKSWMSTPPYNENYNYARLLTHIAKNMTADMSAYVTKMAMELHGGIGFLREFPIERLHREALITPIWEGPSNIQALDMLEALVKKKAHLTLIKDMENLVNQLKEDRDLGDLALRSINESLSGILGMQIQDAQYYAKDLLNTLGNAVATVLLLHAGESLGSSRLRTVGKLYATRFLEGKVYPIEDLRGGDVVFMIDEVELKAETNG